MSPQGRYLACRLRDQPLGRLWDMRGWEYFWGALHPLVMDLAFFVTGSIDIVVARVVSLIFGAFAVALIFALCHRYWGMRVAVVSIDTDRGTMEVEIADPLLTLQVGAHERRWINAQPARDRSDCRWPAPRRRRTEAQASGWTCV